MEGCGKNFREGVRASVGTLMLRVRRARSLESIRVCVQHRLIDVQGQGTVELVLVTAGFLSVIIAGGMFWRVLEGGLFVEHALTAASHHVQGIAPGFLADVFLY